VSLMISTLIYVDLSLPPLVILQLEFAKSGSTLRTVMLVWEMLLL